MTHYRVFKYNKDFIAFDDFQFACHHIGTQFTKLVWSGDASDMRAALEAAKESIGYTRIRATEVLRSPIGRNQKYHIITY